MKKIELGDGIVQYMFEPKQGSAIGYNIIAIIDGKRAVLIDTAFEQQSEQVLEDLKRQGIKPEKIIISHFHNDHIYGLKALPKLPVYGSKAYAVTLDMYIEIEEHQYFTPTHLIGDELTIEFGKHKLVMLPHPGHSQCGLLVMLDGSFVHTGDELIAANDGRAALPSVSRDMVEVHYRSLERLRKYSSYTLIPSHGSIIAGEDRINEEIENRMKYLKAVLSSSGRITVEEATKDCSCEFLCRHWHEYIYES